MIYRVFNDRNILVTVTEQQLAEALGKDGRNLPVEVLAAMSDSRSGEFGPRLREALNHEQRRARIIAAYALLSQMDPGNIPFLREREQSLPDANLNEPISEKGILQAILIRLERGPSEVTKVFFDSLSPALLKSLLIRNCSVGSMPLIQEDVEFLAKALEAYITRSQPWMSRLSRTDFESDVISCLEGLARGAEEEDLLTRLPDDLEKGLCDSCLSILRTKIDPYAKELVAALGKGLRQKVAYDMLAPIMGGRARGELKKELEKTLAFLKSRG